MSSYQVNTTVSYLSLLFMLKTNFQTYQLISCFNTEEEIIFKMISSSETILVRLRSINQSIFCGIDEYVSISARRIEFSNTRAITIPSTECLQFARRLDDRIETVKSEQRLINSSALISCLHCQTEKYFGRIVQTISSSSV